VRRLGVGLAAVLTVLLASGPLEAVTINAGDILVTDIQAGAVFRIDPTTGAQTTVTAAGLLADPFALAIAPTATSTSPPAAASASWASSARTR
jgi:hypothetical protein